MLDLDSRKHRQNNNNSRYLFHVIFMNRVAFSMLGIEPGASCRRDSATEASLRPLETLLLLEDTFTHRLLIYGSQGVQICRPLAS